MATRLQVGIVLCGVLLLAASIQLASACSCMMSHPQTHVCTSDFVIVARVKKVIESNEFTRVFKIKIKKEFKMSEKASVLLKSGRLVTARDDSMCGIQLKPEETYLLTGRIVAGQARISLCNYFVPWKEVTVRQRKGFRLLYKQGCQCKVVDCPWWKNCPKDEKSDYCAWETSMNSDPSLPDCHAKHAICMKRSNGGCGWSTDKQFRECMKNRRRIRDEKLRNEP